MLRRALLSALPLVAAKPDLAFSPAAPFPGSPIRFQLAAGPASATWLDRPLTFSAEGVALAAVRLEVKPGTVPLTLNGGERHPVPVAPHPYRTGVLKVPPQFVAPPPAVLPRIQPEATVKKAVFATRSAAAGRVRLPRRPIRRTPHRSARAAPTAARHAASIKGSIFGPPSARPWPRRTPARFCWLGRCTTKVALWCSTTANACLRCTCTYPALL
jgi:hypothetical protein